MKPKVDPHSYVPKYYQLHEILLGKIEDGEWAPRQSIPSERELEEIYSVSRTTIRKTLDILVSKGYLYREHGRGTFVAPPKLQQSLHSLTSFSEDMQRRGLVPGQRLLLLEYEPPPLRVRQQLGLPDDSEPILKLERLRLADDEPIGIHTAFVPLTRQQPITAAELEQAGSLYELLHDRFNVVLAEADETLEATVADEREAELLQIEVGTPLLRIERLSWTLDRRPIELVRMLYRADRYRYYVHLSR